MFLTGLRKVPAGQVPTQVPLVKYGTGLATLQVTHEVLPEETQVPQTGSQVWHDAPSE